MDHLCAALFLVFVFGLGLSFREGPFLVHCRADVEVKKRGEGTVQAEE